MPKKRFEPEEIIGKLRHADVLLGQGKKLAEVIKAPGVMEVTYYRWHQESSGMTAAQAKRLKEVERENARLHKAVVDLTPTPGASRRPPRETSEPLPPARLSHHGVRGAGRLGTACPSSAWTTPQHAAASGDAPRRRGAADGRDCQVDDPIRPLGLPADHGLVPAGGAEGAPAPAEARPTLADRRLLRSARAPRRPVAWLTSRLPDALYRRRQIRYDLRRFAPKGLIRRMDGKLCCARGPLGRRAALFLTKLYGRVLRPVFQVLDCRFRSQAPPLSRVAFTAVDAATETLLREARLTA